MGAGFTFIAIDITQSCNTLIFDSSVNENTAGTNKNFQGINLENTQNAKLFNCTVHKNNADNGLVGINISNSEDTTVDNCEINQNISLNSNIFGINADSSMKQLIKSTQVNNNTTNSSTNTVIGFNCENCTDSILLSCLALVNGGSAADTSGFRSNTSIKSIYEECIANDNIATNTAIGFELLNTDTSCVLNCIAKRNTGTSDIGRGILLLDCFDCLVDKNDAIGNVGSTIGIGIEVSNTSGGGILTTAVVNNKSQAHDADYITVPGDIPRVGIIFSTGLFTAPPTPFDNLFTQQA